MCIRKEKIGSLEFCEDCVFGKSSRASFKRSNQKLENVIDYIHSDLWGPAQELSLGGTDTLYLSLMIFRERSGLML